MNTYKGYRSTGTWVNIDRLYKVEGNQHGVYVHLLAGKIRKSRRFDPLLVWGRTSDKSILLDESEDLSIENGHHRYLAAQILGLDKVPVVLGENLCSWCGDVEYEGHRIGLEEVEYGLNETQLVCRKCRKGL